MKKITALIPAYNEEKRIFNTVNSLKKSKYINKILVIDDGSTDNTREIAMKTGVDVISSEGNIGKGNALNLGLKTISYEEDIIVFIDADLENTAIEVDKLIAPILYENIDVTIARFKPALKKGGFGLVKKMAQKGVELFTGQVIDSCLSGQRAFKAEVLKNIKKIPSKFGVEIGMLIDILNKGYSVKEVDVDMKHRETGRDINGFIHRGRQFYQILYTLIYKRIEG